MVHVSMALAARETGHGGSAASGKVHGSHNKGPGKPQGQHASSGSPAQAAYNRHLQAAGSSLKPQAPFAQVNKAEVGAGADGDAASIGISTLLSGMERQGSVVSSYLWQQHKTGWTQAREMLRRELDASLGSYVSGHVPFSE
jgi:pyruvate/2-oxoacid:ferredoxin oxidoreductase beta subunit